MGFSEAFDIVPAAPAAAGAAAAAGQGKHPVYNPRVADEAACAATAYAAIGAQAAAARLPSVILVGNALGGNALSNFGVYSAHAVAV